MVYFLYIPFHLLLSIGKYSKKLKRCRKIVGFGYRIGTNVFRFNTKWGGVAGCTPPFMDIYNKFSAIFDNKFLSYFFITADQK